MTFRNTLMFKAQILSQIRSHFMTRGAVEVHTPTLLEATVAHPTTRLFCTVTTMPAFPSRLYLQPSPELAMRELVAAGSGEIFQICKAYRDEEADATHSREFMLLEWYVPGMGYLDMAAAVCDLVREVVPRPVLQVSCAEVFGSEYDASLHTLDMAGIAAIHARVFGGVVEREVAGVLFDDLLAYAVRERATNHILCMTDYPLLDPCFARLAPGGYVERFEILLDGIEIANGYQEIECGRDYESRFAAENEQRTLLGNTLLPDISVADIGTCSGVAIGLERLISLAIRDQSA